MKVLGIESTAHTYGVGIYDASKRKILCNIRDTYKTDKGGIIPTEAAKHHEEVNEKILNVALKESKIKLKDIDLVSFSQGPGLAPSLIVGMREAKRLSSELNIPVVGVNHCIAHLEIGKFVCNIKDPVFLFISGANTQVISYSGARYRIF
ncbi:MAG: hypothetical protein AABX59_02645, partial [Nanoarchaeota archaeon]